MGRDHHRLRRLLESEMTVALAYRNLRQAVDHDGLDAKLLSVERRHVEAAVALRRRIEAGGGRPRTRLRIAGRIAIRLTGVVASVHQPAALALLSARERLAVRRYKSLIDDPALPASTRSEIRRRFLPRQRRNAAVVRRWRSRRGRLHAQP